MKVSFAHYILAFITVVWLVCCTGAEPSKTAVNEFENYKQGMANLTDNQAGKIVKKAIDYCGGWDRFVGLKSVNYTKKVTLYDSTGAITRTSIQDHQYNIFPEFNIRMEYEQVGDQYLIMNNGQQSWKLKNDTVMTDQASINSAYNSSFGSNYVFFQPFKLADPGVALSYAGKRILPNGEEVESVQVNYTEAHTTTDHVWWYFFDLETGEPVGNLLDYKKGFTYTEYLDFEMVDGLKLNTKRKSYTTDKEMSSITLKTMYQNLEISFSDKIIPRSLFNLED